MTFQPLRNYPVIEVRGFKWPRRPTGIASAYLIGEDDFGQWIGVAAGNPWWTADGTQSGVFHESFVKLFPVSTFWTACFYEADISVDVDISLPIRWVDGAVEEIDLELDVLYSASSGITVRDRDKFECIRDEYGLPPEVARRAEDTCQHICAMIERGDEPFGGVGFVWLHAFLQSLKR